MALLIFGLTFAVLARIVQTGVLQSARAGTMTTATLLARSQLARIGADVPIAPGELEGDAGAGFRWRIVVRPAEFEGDHRRDPEAERGDGGRDDPEASRSCCRIRSRSRSPGARARQQALTLTTFASVGAGGRAVTPPPEPAATGFTLVEILVAITLLGLLMAALSAACSSACGGGRRARCASMTARAWPRCRASCASVWRRRICPSSRRRRTRLVPRSLANPIA